ncbi:MAG: DUF2948 family protein [Aliidongia sp.]
MILASCLQDALVMIGDMAYLPEPQRFVLVANRFRLGNARAGSGACHQRCDLQRRDRGAAARDRPQGQ